MWGLPKFLRNNTGQGFESPTTVPVLPESRRNNTGQGSESPTTVPVLPESRRNNTGQGSELPITAPVVETQTKPQEKIRSEDVIPTTTSNVVLDDRVHDHQAHKARTSLFSKVIKLRIRPPSTNSNDSIRSTHVLPFCRLVILKLYSSHIFHGLILLLVTLIGSMLFHYVETAYFVPGDLFLSDSPFDDEEHGRLVDVVSGSFFKYLKNVSLDIQSLMDSQSRSNNDPTLKEEFLNESIRILRDILNGVNNETSKVLHGHYLHRLDTTPFTKLQSFMFSVSIYTTIGYGNVTPQSEAGRLCVILFGMVSIPLWMVNLSHIAKALAKVLKFIWSYCLRKQYERRMTSEVTASEREQMDKLLEHKATHLPLTIAILVIVIYLILGVPLHKLIMGWSIIECVYYVFVSICTIGFGDYTPGDSKIFWTVSMIYILFGLTLVAMTINLWVERIAEGMATAGHQIKASRRATKRPTPLVKAPSLTSLAAGSLRNKINKLRSKELPALASDSNG